MKAYLDILDDVITNGKLKTNRTGVNTLSVSGLMFKHNMNDGFPILRSKTMSLKNIAVEAEGFLRGVTNKEWYQKRGCHIWDEWCNPTIVEYGHDELTQQRMKEENDLGPIYGYQWRNFNSSGIDQLLDAINLLKLDPNNRRIIVSAWNPQQFEQMALPPCHYAFQLIGNGEVLDLMWVQRSVDVGLGLPYNISSFGLILELIADEVGMKVGTLIGALGDVHVYENHIDKLKMQLERRFLIDHYPLPKLKLTEKLINEKQIDSIGWTYRDFELIGYESLGKISLPIAI